MQRDHADREAVQAALERAIRSYETSEAARRAYEASGIQALQQSAAALLAKQEAVRRFLAANPLPDPNTLRALVDEARRAHERATAAGLALDAASMQRLADEAQMAYQQSQAFLTSNPLPSPAVLGAARAAHIAYLDELDSKYGPVPDDLLQAADELLDEVTNGE